jgi:hypothetical protein
MPRAALFGICFTITIEAESGVLESDSSVAACLGLEWP